MENLIKTSEEILEAFNSGEEIPGYKFLQLEIALKQARQNER